MPSHTPSPSAEPPLRDTIAQLLRNPAAYRQSGAPHARFVHIDRFPCLLPLLAGAAVALVALAGQAFAAAGAAVVVGCVATLVLWWKAPAPHVQAVLGNRLILRRWWRQPLVLAPADVRRVLRVDTVGRTARYRRSLFEVEVAPPMPVATRGAAHRFALASRPAADALHGALRDAGFILATPPAAPAAER